MINNKKSYSMINNNIQEAYCSFEISKLLKEKGFSVDCEMWYSKLLMQRVKAFGGPEDAERYIEAPTHALAIEWIRVNFNKKIEEYWFTMGANEYAFRIIDEYEEKEIYDSFNAAGSSYIGGYSTPQKAIEAALLYILQNLIP